MAVVEGTKNIIIFCAWAGTILMCFFLAFSGVLRWLSPQRHENENRSGKLNALSCIAWIILGILFLSYNDIDIIALLGNDSNNEQISDLFINVTKVTIKLLMLGTVVLSAAMILFVIFYLMWNVLKIAFAHGKFECDGALIQKIKEKSAVFSDILNTPIILFIITWGILAIFIILPLLMGNAESHSLAETWENGVRKIADYTQSMPGKDDGTIAVTGTDNDVKTNDTRETGQTFYKALTNYILIFIVILGVGLAVVKILYKILEDTFSKTSKKSLLDEYSNSIGILAVGVSLLWTIQSVDFSQQNILEIGGEFVKSFFTVIFIAALAVLTLEIIHLLMDMKQTLIRQEAKHLFVVLTGQIALIVLETMWSFCSAVNNIIGNTRNDQADRFKAIVQNSIFHTMLEHLDEKEQISESREQIFPAFEPKETKK